MLRILLPALFVFALATGPATLPAQDSGTEDAGTATSCELMSCGERGADSDPDGVAVASTLAGPVAPQVSITAPAEGAFLPA